MSIRTGAESNSGVCALFCMGVCFAGAMAVVWGTSKQPPPEDWPNFAFGSSGDLLSIFSVALNPKNFHNPSNVNATILNSCKGIVSVGSLVYNSFSFLQLSELPGGNYRKQAEIYTNFGNDVNGTALDCVVNLLRPMCETRFFSDWKIAYQVLFPVAVVVGFCCLAGIAGCVIAACRTSSNNRNQPASASQGSLFNGAPYHAINSDKLADGKDSADECSAV